MTDRDRIEQLEADLVDTLRTADEWRDRWLAWRRWAETHAPPELSPEGHKPDSEMRRVIDAKLGAIAKVAKVER